VIELARRSWSLVAPSGRMSPEGIDGSANGGKQFSME
jgi:hypothetical protein